MIVRHFKPESSLISHVYYNADTRELRVEFHKHDWKQDCVHSHVPAAAYEDFYASESKGNFYLKEIEPFYTIIKKFTTMAEEKKKKNYRFINGRINLSEVDKELLLKNDFGVQMEITIVYSEEPEQHESKAGKLYHTNGFITQRVPTEMWRDDKDKYGRNFKSPVLGNLVEFKKGGQVVEDNVPGMGESVSYTQHQEASGDYTDDLPF